MSRLTSLMLVAALVAVFPSNAPAQSPKDNPKCEANPVFERSNTPGIGEHLSAGTAVRAIGLARESTPPAPLLGCHTDEVLHEVLGLPAAAIGKLHDAAIVAGPESDPTA